MITKSKIIQLICAIVGGIIIGLFLSASIISWTGVSVPPPVSGLVGAVIGIIYCFAKDDEE
jgi:hypothetical protein